MTLEIHSPTASLKRRKEESLANGHLWIFSGALQQPPHWVEAGGLLGVKSSTVQFLARGHYNPRTDIDGHVLTHKSEEENKLAFFRQRVRHDAGLRQGFSP